MDRVTAAPTICDLMVKQLNRNNLQNVMSILHSRHVSIKLIVTSRDVKPVRYRDWFAVVPTQTERPELFLSTFSKLHGQGNLEVTSFRARGKGYGRQNLLSLAPEIDLMDAHCSDFPFEAIVVVSPTFLHEPYFLGKPTAWTMLEATLDSISISTSWWQFCLLPRPLTDKEELRLLSPDSPKFLFARDLVCSTAVSHRLHLQSHIFCCAPVLTVERVEEIVNRRLLNAYLTAVDDVEVARRESGCGEIPGCEHLKIPSASSACGSIDLNEHFAFHGATSDVIESKVRFGFDPQRGGEHFGAMFGVGTYFALNSSKSDIYTDSLRDPAMRHPRSAMRQLIIARVLMGRASAVHDPQRFYRAPDGCDSVYALSNWNGGAVDHPEFIVYRDRQASPLFVVTYLHSCPEHALCAECTKRPV